MKTSKNKNVILDTNNLENEDDFLKKKPSDKNAVESNTKQINKQSAEKNLKANQPESSEQNATLSVFNKVWKKTKKCAHYVFIDGLSGMTLGLFATLIIGTILSQIGEYVGHAFIKRTLLLIGSSAKILMGPGIGVGMSLKFKKAPLLTVSAGVAGFIGAQATAIMKVVNDASLATNTFAVGIGEPVGAFVAAIIAITLGSLVSGKTKVDIIVTPIVAITLGAIAGLLAGPPVSAGMNAIGEAITWAMNQNKFVMGLIIAVLMGMALTAPISSAALGLTLNLTGLAAGAATVGCCCQMIGFAVSSFRENKWGGLISQGLGTSMLQMPNIMKRPIIWLPPIIASAILGPVSASLLGMTNNAIGSGMGTAGLVGPLMTFKDMTDAGVGAWQTVLQIGLMHFLLPAVICLIISEIMRKTAWIRKDDMRLSIA